MYFSIDRIVQGQAMLIGEDEKPMEIPVWMLPDGAKSGDMLLYTRGKFVLAEERAKERRQGVADMLGILLKNGDEEN